MNRTRHFYGGKIYAQWIVMITFSLCCSAIILIMGDWLLGRYIVVKQFGANASDDWRQTVTFDPSRLYRGKPNIKGVKVFREAGRFYHFVTHNSLGLRTPEIAKNKKGFRILAVGDSTTWGYGVEDTETWPYYLQQRLDPTATEIEVVNAGIVGYSAFQIHDYLKHEGMNLAPDIVLVTTGFNDVAKSAFRDLADIRYSLGYVNKVRRIIAMATDADHTDVDNGPRLEPEDYFRLLVEISNLCSAGNARAVFLDWPDLRAVVDPEAHPTYRDLIRQVCKSTDTDLICVYDMLVNLLEPVFLDMCHFSARGNYLVAAFLADRLRPFLPALSHIPKDDWTVISDYFNVESLLHQEGPGAVLQRCAFLDVWFHQHHSNASIQWEIARIGLMLPDECSAISEFMLRRVAEMAPYIAPVFLRLDPILEIQYGKEARCAEWQRISAITPYSTSSAVYYLLGKSHAELGNLPQALAAINKALDMEYRMQYKIMQTKIQEQINNY